MRGLFACLLVSAVLPLIAEGAGIYLSTETGLLHGKTLELVLFGPNTAGLAEDYRVSRLDWSLGPTPYWGSRLDWRSARGFQAGLALKAALPGLRGAMEDYDYLDYGQMTHYSRHENHIERALFAEAEVGWDLPAQGGFHFFLGAGLGAMSFKWTAREGYYQYASGNDADNNPLTDEYVDWSESIPKEYVYGTGIGYEQLWLLPRLSLAVATPLGTSWELQAGIAAFPYAFCRDLDNHFYTGFDFIEIMGGGFWLKPELGLERSIDARASFYFKASGHIAWGLVGDAYKRSTVTGGSVRFEQGGGTELWDLQLGLGYRLKL